MSSTRKRLYRQRVACDQCGKELDSDYKESHSKRLHMGELITFTPIQQETDKSQQLLNVFFGKTPISNSTSSESDQNSNKSILTSASSSTVALFETSPESENVCEDTASHLELHDKPTFSDSPAISETATLETSQECSAEVVFEKLIDFTCKYPSDPWLFRNSKISDSLVRAIIGIGACQPGFKDDFNDFQIDESGRRFHVEWYQKTMDNRAKFHRQWLCYSPESHKIYCLACWLFAEKNKFSYERTFADPNVGFSNFKKGPERIKMHEDSDIHKTSIGVLLVTKFRLRNDQTVYKDLIKAKNAEIDRNRQIMKRLVDVTLFLGKQGLAFRGHREHAGLSQDCNEGNFLELVKFISQYDKILADHLIGAKKNETYLSHHIQNDIIHSVANEVLQGILSEVHFAKYFTIILDSTIDISRLDQCSFSLRYVTKSGDIVERFIMFDELGGASAEDFKNLLDKMLDKCSLKFSDCRGQAYDGASTMSGDISGLQRRVKVEEPTAIYVHCCAHNLNLVIGDSASSSCVQAKLFFGTLENIYSFMTSSLPRLKLLDSEIQLMDLTTFKLKRHCDTRWHSHKASVKAVVSCIPALVKALQQISSGVLKNTTPKALADANGILTTIKKFEFLVLLVLWDKILSCTNVLSCYLQESDIDIVTASSLVNSTKSKLTELRSEGVFQDVENKAREIAALCEIVSEYKTHRKRIVRRMPGEQASDEVADDGRSEFLRDTYYVIVDILTFQLNERFSDFTELAEKFSALDPKHFSDKTSDTKVIELSKFYNKDVNKDELIDEYQHFKMVFKDLFRPALTPPTGVPVLLKVKEVLPFLIENDMGTAFPNLTTLYKIFLTIPVSSASSERSFSRLKLIKNHLRSTMAEDRLSNLALINIERNFAKDVDFDKVIQTFSTMKKRRKLCMDQN